MINETIILEQLGITEDILNIYPYGSHVYGNATENSDSDYVIVTKSGMLKSGGFKQNAISNKDRSIQGVLYSRSGFIDAINNYEITALECLSLPDEKIIKKTWDFKIQKWEDKAFIKSIIIKMSASWFSADNYARDEYYDLARKGVYHAIRILMFAQQLKDNHKVTDFSVANEFKKSLNTSDEVFDTRNYIKLRDELVLKLKG
jgi:hypothetical protein